VPILPNAIVATSAWRVRSWDRTVFPKPFSSIVFAYGEPVEAPKDDSRESVEKTRAELERRLNALHEQIEDEFGVNAELG
jgi:lysophospholipid acyltransferase (LPLAT)-like uncharacterized protein